MNPEIKAKWVEALRSGEYKQGRLTLKSRSNEYCCLGVLCVATGHEPGVVGTFNEPDYEYVMELLGSESTVDRFTGMNDQLRLSFAEIADYIEREL